MSPLFLTLSCALVSRARAALLAVDDDQRGQATAEYALVLLGAAAIALLLAAWAAKSGAISKLFDAVVDQLIGEVG
jgi:Flp pilus assembly pilin Flp